MKKFLHRLLRALLFVTIPALMFYFTTVVYIVDRMRYQDFTAADCAVVFGTAVRPVYGSDGTVTSAIAGPGIDRRISTVADLFREGRVRRIFLTGGRGEGNPVSEAEVMRSFAISRGVPDERIIMEERSRSTWENLLFTRPLTYDCDSVVAISDHYHVPRIALYAQAQNWDIETYSAETTANWAFTAKSVLREALGIDWLVVLQLLT